MNVTDIETAVTLLTPEELKQFIEWFAEYRQTLWDVQIEQDSAAGRFDALIAEANCEFDAGNCREI
jgi:hypothetical protein